MLITILLHVPLINLLYASAGLALLAGTIVLWYDYRHGQTIYHRWIEPKIWLLIILTTFGGVLTTLFYSEILGFIPCSLCWLQRIALYPQALMSIAAYKLRDTVYFPLYGSILSGFGLVVATYHYIYQNLPEETLQSGFAPCLADGTADCTDKVMEIFGFVTFPFLSAILFLFLITLFLHMRKADKKAV